VRCVGSLAWIVASGLAIAGAQGCMALFARGLPQPFDAVLLLRYSLFSWTFYGFVALYGAGMYAMLRLLRRLTLPQVFGPIVGVTILAGVLFTFALGQTLGWAQLLGIAMVFAGMLLLR
jgi:drug/metabolite transporter (DMT)-like permease